MGFDKNKEKLKQVWNKSKEKIKKLWNKNKEKIKKDDEGTGSERVETSGPMEGLWWNRECGEFSVAMVQANTVLEDQCEVVSWRLKSDEDAPRGIFVGVYDGHAGPEAAWFIKDRLFKILKEYTSEKEDMSADVIRQAYLKTDEEFLQSVESEWLNNPKIASAGSCCLTGVVCNGMLYIANAGDSRAVLGKHFDKSDNALTAVRLSEDHNANINYVRQELQDSHPNDPSIVVFKQGIWRVRGLIQITRCIGDAYLKRAHFNRAPLLPKFIQTESFIEPILKAEPAIQVQQLTPDDHFVIFASDGLWDHLTDQDAVNLVKRSPRNGIARELVKAALTEAARKQGMVYSDLKKVGKGIRRNIHDDITVVVLFFKCDSAAQNYSAAEQASSAEQGSSAAQGSGGPVMLAVKSPTAI